jgi:hypothetical protein
MRVVIAFNIDNAAFEHNDEFHVVLDAARDKIMFQLNRHVHFDNPQAAASTGLLDSNGNTVGSVRVEP